MGNSAVKERPILFSGPMVRAILEGRKTQTRRVITPDNCKFGSAPELYWEHADFSKAFVDGKGSNLEYLHVPCHVDDEGQCAVCDEWGWPTTVHRLWPRWWPYDSYCGEENERPPHRFWVRETFAIENNEESYGVPEFAAPRDGRPVQHHTAINEYDSEYDTYPRYRATEPDIYLCCEHEKCNTDSGPCQHPWRPSIFMPRWASRLDLDISRVRFQRLQEISEEDATAEGTQEPSLRELGGMLKQAARTERQVFQRLWDSINAKRGHGWSVNDWVLATTFKRVERSA